MKFAFISEQKVAFSIVSLCRVLEVSSSGYHAWHGRPVGSHAERDATLDGHVRAAYAASKAGTAVPAFMPSCVLAASM